MVIDEKALENLRHGMPIDAPDGSDGLAGAYSPQGKLIGILESVPPGNAWHPKKVFLDGSQR